MRKRPSFKNRGPPKQKLTPEKQVTEGRGGRSRRHLLMVGAKPSRGLGGAGRPHPDRVASRSFTETIPPGACCGSGQSHHSPVTKDSLPHLRGPRFPTESAAASCAGPPWDGKGQRSPGEPVRPTAQGLGAGGSRGAARSPSQPGPSRGSTRLEQVRKDSGGGTGSSAMGKESTRPSSRRKGQAVGLKWRRAAYGGQRRPQLLTRTGPHCFYI